jgi:hypothetical protein
VEKVNIRVSTALGNFTGCIETRETTTLAPGDIEYKYYCPNVGVVRVVAPSADGGRGKPSPSPCVEAAALSAA